MSKRIVSEETREKLRKIKTGSSQSEETKEKLRIINTGKFHSAETKEKISKSLRGENNPNWGKFGDKNHSFGKSYNRKPVVGESNGERIYFNSARKASRFFGLSDSCVELAIRRKIKCPRGKYFWKYIDIS